MDGQFEKLNQENTYIPDKLVEWAKTIFTQLRPWTESNNMKWKMILTDAEDKEEEKYKDQEQENCTAKVRLEEDCMYISTGIDNLTTKDVSKLADLDSLEVH